MPSHSQAPTLRDLVHEGATRFAAAGVFLGQGTADPEDEALELVLAAADLDYDIPESALDQPAAPAVRARAEAWFEQRVEARRPAAYLTGRAWFAGLRFAVDERVLVPRSPFAELIEERFQPWLTRAPARILDLCTGSGCIGIACAYAFPEAEVVLSDLSDEALAVAVANVSAHGLEQRVHVRRSDLFDDLDGAPFDLIVSNPPYVPSASWELAPAEIRAEPRMGLEAGVDGLAIVGRILADAAAQLTPEGVLMVEVGEAQPALEAARPELPFMWFEFSRGGEGVFMLERGQLDER